MLRMLIPMMLNLIFLQGGVEAVMTIPTVLVHGGAGSIPVELEEGKYIGMKNAVRAGWDSLLSSMNVLDAAVSAVRVMEDDPNFNAGRGSKLNILGHVEMDAAVMSGQLMEAGGVACVTGIRHPIEAARAVMENTSHVLLVSDGARKFVVREGVEEAEDDWLITDRSRELLEEYLREHNITHLEEEELWMYEGLGRSEGHGTVGAVVIDASGNLAAATSTGGITGKLPGRVGDSPGVGHGVFADNESAAVSCTGTGETFMKAGVGRRIAWRVEEGFTAQDASEEALNYMKARVGGSGGAVVLDKHGNIGIHWNSEQMAWAYGREGKLHSGINKGDHFIEDLW